jgi:hypothetical protein
MAAAVALAPTTSQATLNKVPNLVQDGIDAFEAKHYDEATELFEKALETQPNDARILFNLGCVKSAQGKYDEAVKLLEDASTTNNTELAIKCRYNLGQIAVDRAKAVLGEKPEEANAETRAKVQEYINRAIADYNTCLEMHPNYPDARHNLELLRVWQKNMEQVWKEKDREARRKSMDLPKFVDWLDKEQRGLRQQGKTLEKQRRSPKRRLAVYDSSKAQRELSEEIHPLKQKITDAINQPQAQKGPPAPGAPGMVQQPQQSAIPPEQKQQIVKALQDMAETAGKSMTTASECLSERIFDDASNSQAESIEHLDQIGAILRPYPELVKKSVAEQRQLTDQSKQKMSSTNALPPTARAMDQGLLDAQRTNASGAPEPLREFTEAIEEKGDRNSATNAIDATPIAPNVSRTDVAEQPAPPTFDPEEAAWQQRFVERWSHLMIGKAEQGLKNLPPEEPKPPKPEGKEPTDEEKPTPEPPKQLSPEEQKAQAEKEKIEGLRESMRRAVELGPQVVRLTREASQLLDKDQIDQAVPRQQEALKLLEKIAEPLKDKNQQNQNQQNQQQQQQSKDQKKQKQDQNKNKDKKDQNKDKDKNKGQKDQQQQAKPKPEKGGKDQKGGAQPKNLSKRQAEAMIRKVKKRQDEAEKTRLLIQEKMYGPRKVEKDW